MFCGADMTAFTLGAFRPVVVFRDSKTDIGSNPLDTGLTGYRENW
jgi:hypothetical protein